MKNFNQILKQAQQMQSKMQEAQEKVQQIEVKGTSGGGMVEVTMNGKNEMIGLKLDKNLVNPDEIEILEDLIVAACNDAKNKITQATSTEMEKVTGGLELPAGLKLPF